MVYLNQKSLANVVFSGTWFLGTSVKNIKILQSMYGWVAALARSDTFFFFLTKISQNIQHVTLIFTLITKSGVLFVNLCRCLFVPVACCLIYVLLRQNENHDVSKVSPLQTKFSLSSYLYQLDRLF